MDSVTRQRGEERDALANAQEAYDLSVLRYREGVGNYLQVLSAETQLLAQRSLEAQLQARSSTCRSTWRRPWAAASRRRNNRRRSRRTPLEHPQHRQRHRKAQPHAAVGHSGHPGRRHRLWRVLVHGCCVYAKSTDDAYVSGNVVQITPQISGTVVGIGADDTQFVNGGADLVRLDQADAKVALEEAEAELARTVREVRSLFATTAQLQAAQVQPAQTDLDAAQQDLARRERLGSSGAISGEELQHARDAVLAAAGGAARGAAAVRADRARIEAPSRDHPQVRPPPPRCAAPSDAMRARSCRRRCPGSWRKRNVQLGQRVGPGTPLMAVVPLIRCGSMRTSRSRSSRTMRVGQPVTLTADLYGGAVYYHGTVVGFGAGTGAAFALLPAQNATGNWIKIVQRVPVRIALDPRELAAHPLQIGLSMRVEVSTVERDGARLPPAARRTRRPTPTAVFDDADRQADAQVKAIIAANLPRRTGRTGGAGDLHADRQVAPRHERHPARRRRPGRPRCRRCRVRARLRRHPGAVARDLHERARHLDRQRVDSGDRRATWACPPTRAPGSSPPSPSPMPSRCR